ncbi:MULTISPECIES: histidine phosphatase family protein [unclassified Thioalkalivibrio]|uniref:histidine phosphatase family protein n=1 Tax=unclassified Thioalkalivibrio TaxID=2621013 RepID=UPI000380B1FE|nr:MULTISPECIES: histidine phosphatase family protein [unclassified Thioalkalivibrio]
MSGRAFWILGAFLLGLVPVGLGAEELSADQLIERLQGGGLVVFWRHAETDRSYDDYDLSDMDDCAGQRNLSTLGRNHARRVGDGFRALGISVEQVLTSPFCRNWETAALAFDDYEIRYDLFNLPWVQDEARRAHLIDGLTRHLHTPPKDPASNIVVVGHDLNLRQAVGLEIQEAELAVFVPAHDGPELLGVLAPADFPEPDVDRIAPVPGTPEREASDPD